MEQQQVPAQTDDEAYGLAAKEELAIQALLSNPTLKKAAAAAGISYEELCQRMIDLALQRSPVAV